MKTYKVEFFQKKSFIRKSRWHWKIKATNGRLIDRSTEGFYSKQGAEENAEITARSLAKYFGFTIVE